MSEPQNVFVIGPDTRAEAILFAVSVGRSLSRGCEVRFVVDEPERLIVRDPALARLRIDASEIVHDRARVILCGEVDPPARASGPLWSLSVVDEPVPVVRIEGGGARQELPLVMSPAILRRFGRALPEVPRILVALSGDGSRRERMIRRTCEELGARRWPHTLVAVVPAAKAARGLDAVEAYARPDASVLAALIASSTLVLDAVEGDDPPSPVSCLAASVGVPVIAHATSLLVRRKHGEIRPVAEWSPDAFADAVIESAAASPGDLSWGAEFEVVAEDFGRALRRA